MEKPNIKDNEKEIIRMIPFWLEHEDRTDLIKRDNSVKPNVISFKILNKEKLAEAFGLQWDTMQRKMKKLGFYCVPERGCAVTERLYHLPLSNIPASLPIIDGLTPKAHSETISQQRSPSTGYTNASETPVSGQDDFERYLLLDTEDIENPNI